jgi:hypothetical protein
MPKYKVMFHGYAYVEADNEADAQEKLEDEDYAFMEYGIASVEEVDEFRVEV